MEDADESNELRRPPLLEYHCISSSSAATVLVISQYNTVVACSLATPDVTLKLGGEETTILSMGNSHSQGLPSQLNLTHHRPRRNKPSQTSYSRQVFTHTHPLVQKPQTMTRTHTHTQSPTNIRAYLHYLVPFSYPSLSLSISHSSLSLFLTDCLRPTHIISPSL